MINKLNKEKKHISENAAKSAEDLGAAEVSTGAIGHLKQSNAVWQCSAADSTGTSNIEQTLTSFFSRTRWLT